MPEEEADKCAFLLSRWKVVGVTKKNKKNKMPTPLTMKRWRSFKEMTA